MELEIKKPNNPGYKVGDNAPPFMDYPSLSSVVFKEGGEEINDLTNFCVDDVTVTGIDSISDNTVSVKHKGIPYHNVKVLINTDCGSRGPQINGGDSNSPPDEAFSSSSLHFIFPKGVTGKSWGGFGWSWEEDVETVEPIAQAIFQTNNDGKPIKCVGIIAVKQHGYISMEDEPDLLHPTYNVYIGLHFKYKTLTDDDVSVVITNDQYILYDFINSRVARIPNDDYSELINADFGESWYSYRNVFGSSDAKVRAIKMGVKGEIRDKILCFTNNIYSSQIIKCCDTGEVTSWIMVDLNHWYTPCNDSHHIKNSYGENDNTVINYDVMSWNGINIEDGYPDNAPTINDCYDEEYGCDAKIYSLREGKRSKKFFNPINNTNNEIITYFNTTVIGTYYKHDFHILVNDGDEDVYSIEYDYKGYRLQETAFIIVPTCNHIYCFSTQPNFISNFMYLPLIFVLLDNRGDDVVVSTFVNNDYGYISADSNVHYGDLFDYIRKKTISIFEDNTYHDESSALHFPYEFETELNFIAVPYDPRTHNLPYKPT